MPVSAIPLLSACCLLFQAGSGFSPSPKLPRATSHPTLHRDEERITAAARTELGMFTGIIEEVGEVISLETRDDMTLWDGTTGSGTEMVIRGSGGVAMDGAY